MTSPRQIVGVSLTPNTQEETDFLASFTNAINGGYPLEVTINTGDIQGGDNTQRSLANFERILPQCQQFLTM